MEEILSSLHLFYFQKFLRLINFVGFLRFKGMVTWKSWLFMSEALKIDILRIIIQQNIDQLVVR